MVKECHATTADGTVFACQLHGADNSEDAQKPLLVLIPGYSAGPDIFKGFLGDLSEEKYRILIVSNRGVNAVTEPPSVQDKALSIDSMADDVMEIIADLKRVGQLNESDLPHIAGQSMGGAIALSIAARFPKQVASVCTMYTPRAWSKSIIKALEELHNLEESITNFLNENPGKLRDPILEKLKEEYANRNITLLFSESFRMDPKNEAFLTNVVKDQILKDFPKKITPKNQRRQLTALGEFDAARLPLEQITCPATVMGGTGDHISPAGAVKNLHVTLLDRVQDLINDHIIEVETGHAAQFEDRQRFLTALTDALAWAKARASESLCQSSPHLIRSN